MQIFGLHRNIYKLANYACTQELLDLYKFNTYETKERYEEKGEEGLRNSVADLILRLTKYQSSYLAMPTGNDMKSDSLRVAEIDCNS